MFCPLQEKDMNNSCQGIDCMWYSEKKDQCAIMMIADTVTNRKEVDPYDGLVADFIKEREG